MAHKDALPIAENLNLHDLAFDITNGDEEVTDLMANTNADGWGLDTYDNLQAWFEGYAKIGFSVEMYFIGDQKDESSFMGTKIKAKVRGQAINKNGKWVIDSYSVEEAFITDFGSDFDGD